MRRCSRGRGEVGGAGGSRSPEVHPGNPSPATLCPASSPQGCDPLQTQQDLVFSPPNSQPGKKAEWSPGFSCFTPTGKGENTRDRCPSALPSAVSSLVTFALNFRRSFSRVPSFFSRLCHRVYIRDHPVSEAPR